MSIAPKAPAAAIENIRGKMRYTFSRVNMTNLPAQYTHGTMTVKPGSTLRLSFLLVLGSLALGVGILVRQMGSDRTLALLLAGIAAGVGLMVAAIIGDKPEADVVITVCDSGITVQRGSHLLTAPARVSRNDILSVMLTPAFPGTFTAGKPGAAIRSSSALVLQRRSMAPYVLVSGCSQESLAPLAKHIAERFGLNTATLGPATTVQPAAHLHQGTAVQLLQQPKSSHIAQVPTQSGYDGLNNAPWLKRGLDILSYPADYPDRRISIREQDGTLVITVRRTSSFWQPTTLTAILLIEIPILTLAFTLGLVSLYGLILDKPGHYAGPGFLSTATVLGISSAVLLVTMLAAKKGVIITAEPLGLTVYTTFFWHRRRLRLPAADIVTFGVRQSTVGSFLGETGAVLHDLVVETKSRGDCALFRTLRLSEQQVGTLATYLRRLYGV